MRKETKGNLWLIVAIIMTLFFMHWYFQELKDMRQMKAEYEMDQTVLIQL